MSHEYTNTNYDMELDEKSSQSEDSNYLHVIFQKISSESQNQIELTDNLIKNSIAHTVLDKLNVENKAKNRPLAEEIENTVQELLKENVALKDALQQNQNTMKKHLNALMKCFDELSNTNQNYKQKYDETKEIIFKLKVENNKLKKPVSEIFGSMDRTINEKNKLSIENQLLKEKLTMTQQKLCKLEQHLSGNNRTEKEQELIQVIANFSKQLENAERSRRKLSLDVDRLTAQELKLQRILSYGNSKNVTNFCYWNAIFPAPVISANYEAQLVKNLQQHEELLNSLENMNDELNKSEESNCINRFNITQNEDEENIERLKLIIVELRKKLLEEYSNRKEILNNARKKFEEIYKQCITILKEYNVKLKAQEIEIVKYTERLKEMEYLRHELSDKQNRIIQFETDYSFLEKKLEEAERKNEDLYFLQSQMKVYEEDFISEREARETLIAEKQILESNINCLKQKNKELLKQLHTTDEGVNNSSNTNKPCEISIDTNKFACFNETCHESFASEEELQTHVYSCLNIKD